MLRKFRIKLNEKKYEVEMEEIGVPQQTLSIPQNNEGPKVVDNAPKEEQEVKQSPLNMSVEGGTEVISPMPGNILDVVVKVGDVVKENQVLLVLEAMKMENNIVSPKEGTVVAINVSKGENVNVGAVMVVVK